MRCDRLHEIFQCDSDDFSNVMEWITERLAHRMHKLRSNVKWFGLNSQQTGTHKKMVINKSSPKQLRWLFGIGEAVCWRDRKNYNNLIKVQRIICQWFECASAVFSDYLEHLIIQAIRRVFVFEYCAVQSYFYKLRQCQPTFSTQLVITLIITSNIFAYKNQKINKKYWLKMSTLL